MSSVRIHHFFKIIRCIELAQSRMGKRHMEMTNELRANRQDRKKLFTDRLRS